jgi:hypothetical protein
MLPLHVRDDLGTFSQGAGQMRGKSGGLRDAIPAKSLESRYLPTRQFLIKKQTVQWDLVALSHSCGLGVLRDEVRVVKMGTGDEELMNSWWLQRCPWLSIIFYDAHGWVIWGYLNVPLWYKKLANVMPQLKVTPRGVTFAEFALVSNWRSTFEYKMGGGSITVFFFPSWHITQDGCLAMNAPSQKVGVHMLLYFIVDRI